MSLTLTLSGKSSVLTDYFPPIDLSDGEYEFGFTTSETYTIPNVILANNKFYLDDDDKEITISEGSYEIDAINVYLKHAML